MITKIKFKNYKAFPDFEELELRPITLIIGKIVVESRRFLS